MVAKATPRTESMKLQTANAENPVPPLSDLATHIRLGLEKAKANLTEWRLNMMVVAEALAQARKQFKADRDFGKWLTKQRIALAPADRAAVIKIGENIELAKAAASDIDTRSLRQFWLELEGRFSGSENLPANDDTKPVASGIMPATTKAGRPRKGEATGAKPAKTDANLNDERWLKQLRDGGATFNAQTGILKMPEIPPENEESIRAAIQAGDREDLLSVMDLLATRAKGMADLIRRLVPTTESKPPQPQTPQPKAA